jgi:hypothetical protein
MGQGPRASPDPPRRAASIVSRKFVDTIPPSFRPSGRVHARAGIQANTKKNLDPLQPEADPSEALMADVREWRKRAPTLPKICGGQALPAVISLRQFERFVNPLNDSNGCSPVWANASRSGRNCNIWPIIVPIRGSSRFPAFWLQFSTQARNSLEKCRLRLPWGLIRVSWHRMCSYGARGKSVLAL